MILKGYSVKSRLFRDGHNLRTAGRDRYDTKCVSFPAYPSDCLVDLVLPDSPLFHPSYLPGTVVLDDVSKHVWVVGHPYIFKVTVEPKEGFEEHDRFLLIDLFKEVLAWTSNVPNVPGFYRQSQIRVLLCLFSRLVPVKQDGTPLRYCFADLFGRIFYPEQDYPKLVRSIYVEIPNDVSFPFSFYLQLKPSDLEVSYINKQEFIFFNEDFDYSSVDEFAQNWDVLSGDINVEDSCVVSLTANTSIRTKEVIGEFSVTEGHGVLIDVEAKNTDWPSDLSVDYGPGRLRFRFSGDMVFSYKVERGFSGGYAPYSFNCKHPRYGLPQKAVFCRTFIGILDCYDGTGSREPPFGYIEGYYNEDRFFPAMRCSTKAYGYPCSEGLRNWFYFITNHPNTPYGPSRLLLWINGAAKIDRITVYKVMMGHGLSYSFEFNEDVFRTVLSHLSLLYRNEHTVSYVTVSKESEDEGGTEEESKWDKIMPKPFNFPNKWFEKRDVTFSSCVVVKSSSDEMLRYTADREQIIVEHRGRDSIELSYVVTPGKFYSFVFKCAFLSIVSAPKNFKVVNGNKLEGWFVYNEPTTVELIDENGCRYVLNLIPERFVPFVSS